MKQREADEFLEDDPLWYQHAVIYQLHVRAFADGYQDGVGDFRGLTEKLDYLQDLGITAIWLLPFYPSPLKDDGYDTADYTSIHPNYGTLRDFETFLREAHRRGLRVITELVLNHTSDQHPWFQRARRAPPGSPLREFYVWSDTPDRYLDARIIFKDFEISNWTYDPVAKAYFWHRFYAHQPDLNFDNPAVHEALFNVVDFWFGMGVDGLRLDAVPYLYEREGTNCENLPETHQFLKTLRRHVDERFKNRMLLAEANQWPEDAVAYFGAGDECHTAFHFPLMPRLFMAIRMEDRFPIVDIMAQTPAIPPTCQWAVFLRNHDELTLEMVTDEERDYMYRVYAQDKQARINLGIRRRLAPLLENNRRRIELMTALLFSMPGTPVLYYGDEIGMGDNIYLGDRNGVRTPMQWSAERNAGFSRVNPQRLYQPVIIDPEYHYQAINVENQQNNPSSLLWWMKRLIAQRKRFKTFGHGSIEFLSPANPRVLALLRHNEGEVILVVANLARLVQHVELNLAEFAGWTPVELFGLSRFPAVEERPYPLTLGPYGFYWFELEPAAVTAAEAAAEGANLPEIAVPRAWENVLRNRPRDELEELLPTYLRARRGFGGQAGRIEHTAIEEVIPVPYDGRSAELALVRVQYAEDDPETYVLPLAFAAGDEGEALVRREPHAGVARLRGGVQGLLYDAVFDPEFGEHLLGLIREGRALEGKAGVIQAEAFGPAVAEVPPEALRPVTVHKTAQNNTTVVFGERLLLKLFRCTEEGINPDVEITRFLSEGQRFPHVPRPVGVLEYRAQGREPMTVGLLQEFVPHTTSAWQYTQDALSRYYERALASKPLLQGLRNLTRALLQHAELEPPDLARETIADYLEAAALLGRRTAELHLALASDPDRPAFAPEPFTAMFQRSMYQSMRNATTKAFQALRRQAGELPEGLQESARKLLEHESELGARYRLLLQKKLVTERTRTHGDYHLGQLLHTGKDFMILDFEGNPGRSVSERRIKRTPLRDVAAMLRSFHYAASTVLLGQVGGLVVRPEDLPTLEPWANFWHLWVGSRFLRAYLDLAKQGTFLPDTPEELQTLLDSLLLEKAVHELAFELRSRPAWLRVPLDGLLQLLSGAE